jgi:hypothetical protein
MHVPAIEYYGDRPCLPPQAYPQLARTPKPTLNKPSLLRRVATWLRGTRGITSQ